MMNKKGVSDVITNVLIILIVLVAVAILWFFVRPTIVQGAGGVSGAATCYSVILQPLKCGIGAGTPNDFWIQVERSEGEGDMKGVKVIFRDSAGNVKNTTDIIGTNGVIQPLQTRNLSGTIGGLSSGASYKLTLDAIVESAADPEGRLCGESSISVSCTAP